MRKILMAYPGYYSNIPWTSFGIHTNNSSDTPSAPLGFHKNSSPIASDTCKVDRQKMQGSKLELNLLYYLHIAFMYYEWHSFIAKYNH